VINSIPKAGTHLIASVLSRVPGIKFSGQFITHHFASTQFARLEGEFPEYDEVRLDRAVKKIRAGTFGNCHLYYDEYTRGLLTSSAVSALFMIRDPRDILVSQLNYLEQFRGHPHHRHLMSEYPMRTERLDALINGWEPNGPLSGQAGMADFGTRLRAFKGWSNAIPTFKFEEFTSTPDREGLDHSLRRLLQAAGLAAFCDVESVRAGIGDKWSATLHKATTGGWRDVLSPRQASRIAELAGDYFTEYGYKLT